MAFPTWDEMTASPEWMGLFWGIILVVGGGIAKLWKLRVDRGTLTEGQRQEFRRRITRADHDLRDLHIKMAKEQGYPTPSPIVLSALNLSLKANLAETRNAYEEVCLAYLNKSFGKKRFRDDYGIELRQLVESELHRAAYQEPHSKLVATIKVYKELTSG